MSYHRIKKTALLSTFALTSLLGGYQGAIDMLDRELKAAGYTELEGHMCQTPSDQPNFFYKLLSNKRRVKRVLEIGFNGGHSSAVFLSARDDIEVVSFDLLNHKYSLVAKAVIDRLFPGRHSLIGGDSRETLPAYIESHPGEKFDFIFIDGGHAYEVAKSDILNTHQLAHRDTIVLLDDAFENMEPEKAALDCQRKGLLVVGKRYISAHRPEDWPKCWCYLHYLY